MTIKNISTVERALGIIEGAICIAPKNVRDALAKAVAIIDGVLEEEGNNNGQT